MSIQLIETGKIGLSIAIVAIVAIVVLIVLNGIMLFQSIVYSQSTLQEMTPIARGKFIIYRDCYNSPQYYIDANPIPADWSVGKHFPAMKMDNRSEWVYITSLREGSTYNLYVRQGLLKNYYFVECVN
jgi:hypothetical protein